ncbi:MAG: sialidase family protein, partial [Candidatus Gallimonas sp.]
RTNLTAYLSTDDGRTFPYKLLLDDRVINVSPSGFCWGVSYPEASARQGENGEIYIAYDAGRYDHKEIRLAVITEKDIMAGEPISAGSALRMPVIQGAGYCDLVSVSQSTAYGNYRYVEKGTTAEEIVSSLPQTVIATDQSGAELTLTGAWRAPENYDPQTAARYAFTFETTLPQGTLDGRGLLTVYVGVGIEDPDEPEPEDPENPDGPEKPGDDTKKSGCGSVAFFEGGVMAGLALAGTCLALLGKRRRDKKKD